MKTNTTYAITTIADLVEVAKKTKNIEGLFADLEMFVAAAEAFGSSLPKGVEFNSRVFQWVDDGDTGISSVKVKVKIK